MDTFVKTLRECLVKSEHIRLGDNTKQLSCGKAVRTPAENGCDKRASVAAVLRHNKNDRSLELLFIKRAVNPRDRWSGDVALPGGRQEMGETDLDTAIRETREEVGLNLTKGGFAFLGQLNDRVASRKGGRRLIVSAFVFLCEVGSDDRKCVDSRKDNVAIINGEIGAAWETLTLQAKEVAEAWWVDISSIINTQPRSKKVPAASSVPAIARSAILRVSQP